MNQNSSLSPDFEDLRMQAPGRLRECPAGSEAPDMPTQGLQPADDSRGGRGDRVPVCMECKTDFRTGIDAVARGGSLREPDPSPT